MARLRVMALAMPLTLFAALFVAIPARAGGVPEPVIPKAKGTHCVRPLEWMRRNHMRLLLHERDEVVHKGVRVRDETLPGCMSCHVSKLADGRYPSVTSKKFFCNTCHAYAGVRIDCFSCHTNRPEPSRKAALAVPSFLAEGDAGHAVPVPGNAARAGADTARGGAP